MEKELKELLGRIKSQLLESQSLHVELFGTPGASYNTRQNARASESGCGELLKEIKELEEGPLLTYEEMIAKSKNR